MQTEYTDLGLWTVAEAMRQLRIGKTKFYELVKGEGLPVERFGRRVLVRRKRLEEWLDKRSQEAG